MSESTTIVWREWFNASAVKQLTAMGTLPRNETILHGHIIDGEDCAAMLAKQENRDNFERFQETEKIVIIEPEQFAGSYMVEVEYEPSFSAYGDDSE